MAVAVAVLLMAVGGGGEEGVDSVDHPHHGQVGEILSATVH